MRYSSLIIGCMLWSVFADVKEMILQNISYSTRGRSQANKHWGEVHSHAVFITIPILSLIFADVGGVQVCPNLEEDA